MSMYRQLWLALILSTTLSLVGGLLASTFGARTYIQEELRLKNNDTAAALALSLSRTNVDPIEMELRTAALFDGGYFQLIRITDPQGGLIVERIADPAQHKAPQWFVNSLPISAPAGHANISDGWKQLGSVTLVSQSSFAYDMLWKTVKQLMAALFLAGLLGASLGTLILHRLKKPLYTVVEQARAISQRRFFTTPEPKVPELRELVVAMNSSVLRLQTMFEEEAQRLEAVRREVNHDPLTGLANRSYFMARLQATLNRPKGSSGQLLLIRIANLSAINRELGRGATDTLLKSVAQSIEDFMRNLPDGMAARLNGADFGILVPDQSDARATGDALLQELVRTTSTYLSNRPIAFIGAGSFHHECNPGELLTQVDNALAAAEASGINAVHEAVCLPQPSPGSAEQWGELIRKALEHGFVKLALFPVMDFAGTLIHRESALRLMLSDDDNWMPAGRFLSIAERLGLSAQIDLTVLRLGLEELTRDEQLPGLAINLSGRSIDDADFRQQTRQLLAAHPAAARRLWLEVPEHGALTYLPAFRDFCRELAGSGCRLGVEHFGNQFSQIGKLHNLGLDYFKVDASFVRDIGDKPGNQTFLKGVSSIAHAIGIQVLAEGVSNESELSTLRTLDFDGATGPAVQDKH